MTTEEERYERARKRARELRAFYTHVATYVLVMVLLVFVDSRDHGGWWVYWPALGWGIAVAAHAFETFSTGWEKRKIKKLMERDGKDL
ncbi:MAG: 2TM domain-containing protein [Candidatus Bipolaricaulota bacterium]|nr:MAG: 2TM domain-containing protein [Candidatus Bipolaricaulota bacterium]